MLFCMWFFHWDALCPNRISETVVKHHWDGHPNGEKWFDVSDHWDNCQDDHQDTTLYIG